LALLEDRRAGEEAIERAIKNPPKAFTCIRKAFISSLPFIFVFLDYSRYSLTLRCWSAISITYRLAREQRKATGHLYATAALAGPRSGITSVRRNPTFRHHPSKSRPVKSNASPNSISILSDVIRPKALLRRSSSIKVSITTKAPPFGRAPYAARTSCIFFSRFQSCRIMPMVITSALGRESRKKSNDTDVIRSLSPCASMVLRAMDAAIGRSPRRAHHVRVTTGHGNRQLPARATDVAHGLVRREIELLRERLEVGERDAGHRVHELLEPLGVAVKLFEHSFAAVLHLVLRFARLQSFGQVSPESVKPRIRHVEKTADMGTAVAVEKVSGIFRIAVLCGLALAVSRQHIQSHERVEKVGDAARMKFERVLKLSRGQRLVTQHGKQVQLDG